MTAGPTPLPPRCRRRWPSRSSTTARPAFVELYARVLGGCPPSSARRTTCWLFAASGLGRDGVGRGEPRAPGRQDPRLRGRQVRRALDRARRGLRRPTSCATSPAGATRLDPAEVDRLLGENAGVEVVFATLSETSTGIVHDVQAIAEVARRHGAILAVDAVSGLGAAELRQDEWGIDVVVAGSQKALMCPPGLGFASVSPARARLRARARPGGRYYFDWGRTAKSQRKGATPVHAGRPAVPGARRRARPDRGGGPRQRLRAPRRCSRRATRAGVAGARPRAVRRPRRALDRRDRGRAAGRRSTAARSPAACASSASPPTAARTSSRAGSCGSPTAATSARSTSSRRSPAWRWCSSSSATTSSYGAGVGRGAARVPRGRRPRRGVSLLDEPYRILVKEKIADSGVDAPARALRRRPRHRLGRRASSPSASAPTTASSSARRPSSTADLIDRADKPEGDRPRRRRRRQRRRRGRDQARHHRRQRAAVERRHRGRAHGRADARARAQHPAGARLADRAAAGSARSSAASRSTRRRSASSASAASASSSPPARRAFGMHVRRVRPVRRRPSASASSASSRPRPPTTLYARADFITIHLPKTPETERLARRRGVRQDAATACAIINVRARRS